MPSNKLIIENKIALKNPVLLIGFNGWMDGGEVSTGTIEFLKTQFESKDCATINPRGFYVYNFPGDIEDADLFRPFVKIENGIISEFELPKNVFSCITDKNIILFSGEEPNMGWEDFSECVFEFCKQFDVKTVYFIGSVAGLTPHTRDPRITFSASDEKLRDYLHKTGLQPSDYEGPAGFITYLESKAAGENISVANLVAEIPAYVQGYNPKCIITSVKVIARLLDLKINLDELITESIDFQRKVSELVENQPELAEKIKDLERDYDNEAFDREMGDLKNWLGQQGIRVD